MTFRRRSARAWTASLLAFLMMLLALPVTAFAGDEEDPSGGVLISR